MLINEAHKSKFSIHPWATKMYRDLHEGYWWPGMKREVTKYVEECLTCRKVKAEHQRPHGKLQPLEIPVCSGKRSRWILSQNFQRRLVGMMLYG